jgi:glycosyltransferase involved in cell wall biosynthesis
MTGQPWGGSEVLWEALAKHALEKGDDVLVSVYKWETEHPNITALKSKGATISYREKFNSNAGLAEKIIRSIKVRKPSLNKDYSSIIDFKPDHVFISQGDNFDLALHHRALYTLLRAGNVPYSFVCHSHAQYGAIPPKEIYPDGKAVFTDAKAVYFVSQKQRQLTERKLLTALSNAFITFNPLAIGEMEKPLDFPIGNTVTFAAVGAITGGKGQDTLLNVLAAPQWKNRNWQLNVYGAGEGLQYMRDLAVFYGIDQQVVFHGHVSNVQAIWEINQVLIIPSAAEGLPISLVEAMMCGRCCVATDVGGIDELIEEGITGFIAQAPSVKYLSEAMERAWENKQQWSSMGVMCGSLIRQKNIEIPELLIYKEIEDCNKISS